MSTRQNDTQAQLDKRTFFYASKIFLRFIEKGTKYEEMVKTVVIFITDYIIFPKIKSYHTVWKMTEQEEKTETLEGQELHYIELPKFRKIKPELNNKLNQWLSFIDYENREMVEMAIEKNEKVKEADEEYKKMIADRKKQYLEFLDDLHERDFNSKLSAVMKEGEKKGEKREKNNMARKMLEKQMNIDTISEITGLSKEEILKLSAKK